MAMELKNNEIFLFKNSYKTKDSQPSFRGKCLVEGVEKDASCWINTSKKGDKYLKVVLDKPYVKKDSGGYPSDNANTTGKVEFSKAESSRPLNDEDIPF